jgi:hypothetical protein
VQRIVFGGRLGAGEVWSTGFWTTINGNSGTAAQVAAATVASGSFTNVKRDILQLMNSSGTFDTVTVYQYRTAAVAADDVASVSVGNAPGTNTNFGPYQAACCISLRTDTGGRSGRGRMFFPAIGQSYTALGLFGNTGPQDMVTSLATFFSGRDVVVVSATRGASYPVTRLTTDTRPDIIRARADGVVGVLTTRPVS